MMCGNNILTQSAHAPRFDEEPAGIEPRYLTSGIRDPSLTYMGIRKIIIDVTEQTARLFEGEKQIKSYAISSSSNGIGCEVGSNKTPIGRLRIHKKIGSGEPLGTVFRSRVPSGEICTENPRSPLWQSNEDLVLSRILWLEGADESNLNTQERFIYLHGTNQEHLLGRPASHGCIRLGNTDICELFELVDEGTEVIVLD